MHFPSTIAEVTLGDGLADGEGFVLLTGVGEAAAAGLGFGLAGLKAPAAKADPTPTPATSKATISPTPHCLARFCCAACRSARRARACRASSRWRSFFVATPAILLASGCPAASHRRSALRNFANRTVVTALVPPLLPVLAPTAPKPCPSGSLSADQHAFLGSLGTP